MLENVSRLGFADFVFVVSSHLFLCPLRLLRTSTLTVKHGHVQVQPLGPEYQSVGDDFTLCL